VLAPKSVRQVALVAEAAFRRNGGDVRLGLEELGGMEDSQRSKIGAERLSEVRVKGMRQMDGMYARVARKLFEHKRSGEADGEALSDCVEPSRRIPPPPTFDDGRQQDSNRGTCRGCAICARIQECARKLVRGADHTRGRASVSTDHRSDSSMIRRYFQEQRTGPPAAILIGVTLPGCSHENIRDLERAQRQASPLDEGSFEQDADLHQIVLVLRNPKRRLVCDLEEAQAIDPNLVESSPMSRDRGAIHGSIYLLNRGIR